MLGITFQYASMIQPMDNGTTVAITTFYTHTTFLNDTTVITGQATAEVHKSRALGHPDN
jgi:hypothetical protein